MKTPKNFLAFSQNPAFVISWEIGTRKKKFISENGTFRAQEMKKPTIKMFNIL